MEIPRDRAHFDDDPKVISPPIVQPLYACAQSVNLAGYIPDATLDLEVDGGVAVADFPGQSPTPYGAVIPLPVAFKANQAPPQKLRARQNFGGATSNWTAFVDVRTLPPIFPRARRAPALPAAAQQVRNPHRRRQPPRRVRRRDPRRRQSQRCRQGRQRPAGRQSRQGLRRQAARAGKSDALRRSEPARRRAGGPDCTAAARAADLRAVRRRGRDLIVQGLANGARVELKRNGVPLGTIGCWGAPFTWTGINPPFKHPSVDKFEAAQQLCPGDPSSPPAPAARCPAPPSTRQSSARYRTATSSSRSRTSSPARRSRSM